MGGRVSTVCFSHGAKGPKNRGMRRRRLTARKTRVMGLARSQGFMAKLGYLLLAFGRTAPTYAAGLGVVSGRHIGYKPPLSGRAESGPINRSETTSLWLP